MKTRVISALLIGALALIAIILGGYVLIGFVVVFAAIGLHEFYGAFEKKEYKPIKAIGFLYLLYLVAFFFTEWLHVSPLCVTVSGLNNDANMYSFLQYAIIAASLCALVFTYPKHNIADIAITLLGGYYVIVGFSYFLLLEAMPKGKFLIAIALLGCISADSFALFSGMLFGKKKLAPQLSPKKTVAGSIGAFAGSIVVLLAVGIVFNLTGFYTAIPVYHYAILGLLIGGLAQIGDLSASAMKRYTGIKDFGNLIPGHGGVLDRCDAYLIVVPFVYYYLNVFVF